MDVIEVMARAANDGTESLELSRRDIIDALRAAEKAGWRLVPVEATKDMLRAAVFADCHSSIYEHAIQAAPRPWEEKE